MPDTVPDGRVISGDLVDVLTDWPADSVDLVFADPPFNIGYDYDRHDDNMADEDYVAWTERWIDACLRVLAPDGTFWIAIGDEYAAEVCVAMKARGLSLRNWIIWHYTFGQNCKYKFNRCHTHLLYFVADEANHTFNADDPRLRVRSARQTTYNDKRANPKGRLPGDVWKISRVCGTFKERVGWHPCQMPLAVLDRVILACSNRGDLVLDPFAGSGTTLVSAAAHDRRWVGVELSKDYAARAEERVRSEAAAADEPQRAGAAS